MYNGRNFAFAMFVFRVFCDVKAYVSCRGYDGIPQSARLLLAVNQGGTADINYSSLTEAIRFSVKGFLLPVGRYNGWRGANLCL